MSNGTGKVLNLIYDAGQEFYNVIAAQGEWGDDGSVGKNNLFDRIEMLVSTEATKNGSNVILVPSDGAMREFYRSVGLKSWEELAKLPSAMEFVLAHIGFVKSNIGRGKFGAAAGQLVGGTFKGENQGGRGTEVGYKLKTKKEQSCDEGFGRVKWVVKSKNSVTWQGSANRFDTVYAGREWDGNENDTGRLDCADFYRIPVTLENEQIRLRLLAENRQSYQRKF